MKLTKKDLETLLDAAGCANSELEKSITAQKSKILDLERQMRRLQELLSEEQESARADNRTLLDYIRKGQDILRNFADRHFAITLFGRCFVFMVLPKEQATEARDYRFKTPYTVKRF